MNPETLRQSLELTANQKGLELETVKTVLEDSIARAYAKSIAESATLPLFQSDDGRAKKGGPEAERRKLAIEQNLQDVDVACSIDLEGGHITVCSYKTVVKKDDDVKDDFTQVSLEEAKEITDDFLAKLKQLKSETKDAFAKDDIRDLEEKTKAAKKAIKVGEKYPFYATLESTTKAMARGVRENFRSRLNEAERIVLYSMYKDRIGEMLNGVVERSDERGSIAVNIGHATVELSRSELIGDEFFKPGDPIRVYIQEVRDVNDKTKSRGPQIQATRSSEGFLKKLFEQEIHEIYDGTVLIKGIARKAGIRSKVAVTSTIADIDAPGACIGAGGSRIQSIVSQLGNGTIHERIDIIDWSDNKALYVAEAMHPAQVLGVKLTDEASISQRTQEPTGALRAYIIVENDDDRKKAIGNHGVNSKLAGRLTGYDIDVITEDEALARGIEFDLVSDLRDQVEAERALRERADFAAKTASDLAKATPVVTPSVTPEAPEGEEEELDFVPSKAPAKEEKAEPKKEAPVEAPSAPIKATVKTTKTLDELEKELEESKAAAKVTKPTSKKRPRKIEETEVEHPTTTDVTPVQGAMPIYSEAELEEIAAEEENEEYIEEYTDDELEEYDSYYDEDE